MCDNCKKPDPELTEALSARPLVQMNLTSAGAIAFGNAPALSSAQAVMLLVHVTMRLQEAVAPPTDNEQAEVLALIDSWKLDGEKRRSGRDG